MIITFEPMSAAHRKDVIDLYNYYVEHSFSAYPEKAVPYEYYDRFLDMTKGYPAYLVKVDEKTAGFCFLRAYHPSPTFKECAEITYFIDGTFTGQGIGKQALDKLEAEARLLGIKTLLASIASENHQSLAFHRKHDFTECGLFKGIINKHGKQFDIIWMQKWI